MTEASVHQIYYSAETRAELDPGFLPLDNGTNERPDWREYWPMRRFLLSQTLEPHRYYGFFSPKFARKTTLNADIVHRFIQQQDGTADVISFSPFFDQMALPLNVLELASLAHDSQEIFAQCAAMIVPEFRMDRAVMSSLNTVYCNYFVAKPAFWMEWLSKCEQIFDLAEQGLTPLGRSLSQLVPYDAGSAPAKVFVIERVASLLLWAQSRWRVTAFNPILLPRYGSARTTGASDADLMVLDALKIAYTRSGAEQYMAVYQQLRERLVQRRGALAQGAGATQPLAPHPADTAMPARPAVQRSADA